jgi:hypothetical protein
LLTEISNEYLPVNFDEEKVRNEVHASLQVKDFGIKGYKVDSKSRFNFENKHFKIPTQKNKRFID